MSYQTERDDFLSIMGSEGIRPEVARTLLRESTTLQRLAELECSSERADRDQVRCPANRLGSKAPCLCKDYGSYDDHSSHVATCGRCGRAWCGKCDPGPSALCHYCHGRGRSSASATAGQVPRCSHGTVPRHMVKSAASEARVRKLWAMLGERYSTGLAVHFGGDPRGCMLVVSVPSGRTNDWERRGIAVPSQGYTGAQIDRMGR